MADAQSSRTPPDLAAAPTTQSAHAQYPSAGDGQQKRNHRHRKNPSQSFAQTDGTVSDSVMHSSAKPHTKTAPKQRHQSVALGTPPKQNGHLDKVNGYSQRSASLGGNMLLATPAKEQAYAGPTFQASPAPSSLPVPKFFSRSVPNVAAQSLAARMEGERTPEKEDSSPEPDVVSPHHSLRGGQQSPLDLFFNADKLEKEKSRSSSSLSPEMAARPPPPPTEPRKVQQLQSNPFLQEMDGQNGDSHSPNAVTHNKQHLRRARPTSSPHMEDPMSNGDSEREAHTRALKELLFNNVNGTTQQPTNLPQASPRAQSIPRAPDTAFETPSPFQRSASGPSTPAPSLDQQNHYSLHYGNRNLSPLFKASRNDALPRPSGLRQQAFAGDEASHSDSNIGAQPRPYEIDPNSFSRNFINEHIRASGSSASVPELPFTNTPNLNVPSSSSTFGGVSSSHQHGVIQNGNGSNTTTSGASPRSSDTGTGGNSSSSRDIKGMEDDLRKMLNLKVLSN